MSRLSRQFISKSIVCIWLLAGASNLSYASTAPVFEQVGTIIGPAGGESTPFTIAASGDYLARITDLTFFPGSTFDAVALGISTSTRLLGSAFLVTPSPNDSTSFIFSATPGKYFSNVVATCTGICSYGVAIMAVPLPPAIGLFSIGIVGLAMVRRRRVRVRHS
jgi:hypothetical protein